MQQDFGSIFAYRQVAAYLLLCLSVLTIHLKRQLVTFSSISASTCHVETGCPLAASPRSASQYNTTLASVVQAGYLLTQQ